MTTTNVPDQTNAGKLNMVHAAVEMSHASRLLDVYNHGRFDWKNLISPFTAALVEGVATTGDSVGAANSTIMFLDSQTRHCINALRVSEYDIDAEIAKVSTLSLDYVEYDAFVVAAMAACIEYMRVCLEFGGSLHRYSLGELALDDKWIRFLRSAALYLIAPTAPLAETLRANHREWMASNRGGAHPCFYEINESVLSRCLHTAANPTTRTSEIRTA